MQNKPKEVQITDQKWPVLAKSYYEHNIIRILDTILLQYEEYNIIIVVHIYRYYILVCDGHVIL